MILQDEQIVTLGGYTGTVLQQEHVTEEPFEVLPDEFIAEYETVSADELFGELMAGFTELRQWTRGEIELPITERCSPELLIKTNINLFKKK